MTLPIHQSCALSLAAEALIRRAGQTFRLNDTQKVPQATSQSPMSKESIKCHKAPLPLTFDLSFLRRSGYKERISISG